MYGVEIPGADGKAGMAALSVDEAFDLTTFASHVVNELASYQRPLFLRMLNHEMKVTATLKQQKVDYRKEGYDPSRVEDRLFMLQGDRYISLDAPVYEGITSGKIIPGQAQRSPKR